MKVLEAQQYKAETCIEMSDGDLITKTHHFWALNDFDARAHLKNVILPFCNRIIIRGKCSVRISVEEFHRLRWFVPDGQEHETYELLEVSKD